MSINVQKYVFVHSREDPEVRNQIASLFPYKMFNIYDGFKYLGFYLKPMVTRRMSGFG